MAFDENTAARIRDAMKNVEQLSEVKMMGALIFSVRGHMCCGANKDGLMVRVGPDNYKEALLKPYVKPLDIGGGRQPKAFVVVEPNGYSTHNQLRKWIKSGLVGCLESSVTLYLRHSRHSCVKIIRRRPCYACIFSPCSDDCGCEKFVTELPAQPTRLRCNTTG